MVKLRFDTDIGSTLKAGADLNAAYEKVGNTVKGTTREMNALEKAAKRITDQNLTPQEKYNQKLETMAKAVKAGKLSFDDAEKSAGRMRQRLDEATKSSSGLFGPGAISNIKSYVLGLGSVSTALAAIKTEWDAIKEREEKITQTQLSAAQGRDVLKRNIAGLGIAGATKFEARADKLAAELRLPQQKIDVALAEAYSASGGDVEAAFSRARTAGQFLKTSPEDIGAFAGTLGDISKATRSQDDLRNLGFMIQIGAMSRVANAKAQAKNIPAALAGATKFGATAEEAGALFAATSVGAADFEGAISGTGVIGVTQQLDKFFAKQVKAQKFQAAAVDTFAERMTELRRDPALTQEFVDKVSLEKKVMGPLREFLLDPNSEIAKDYQKNLGGFGTPEQQRATATETIGYLRQGRMAQTAEVERTVASSLEQFRLGQDAQLSQEQRLEVRELSRRTRGQSEWLNVPIFAGRTGPTLSRGEAVHELEYALQNRPSSISPTYDAPAVKASEELLKELRDLTKQQLDAMSKPDLKPPRPAGRQEP